MISIKRLLLGISVIALATFSSCGSNDPNEPEDPVVNESLIKHKAPIFDEEQAYQYIKSQLDFGYRIPGTPAHKKCADYLYAELKKFCDTVYFQKGEAKNYKDETIPVYNLIGSFLPDHPQRAIYSSHWDSRPFADNDENPENHTKPLLGANDGASGVGVLLSMAQALKNNQPLHGIDIIFWDAEDYGKSEVQNSFCLGSQYWGKNKHIANYTANYGVLLDMVGAKDAEFGREAFSEQKAGFVMSHTWGIAQELGFGNHFVNIGSGPTIDDHYYVNQATGIPMIDIIQFDREKGFAEYWHTLRDDMTTIHKPTLKAVGTTMLTLVFNPPFALIE